MQRKRSSLSTIGLVALLSITFGMATAQAQINDPFFYIVLPAQMSIAVDGETLENQSETGSEVFFFEEDEQSVTLDKDTQGIRIVSNAFTADIKKESLISISDILSLNAGSIHIQTAADATRENLVHIGTLDVRFTTANFIAFVSGDDSEIVIKVIVGEVTIESAETQQQAVLAEQEATNTDAEGRLLIPFPVEIDASKGWWSSTNYSAEFSPPPLADTGEDQRVLTNVSVTLNGSESRFDTGDVFEWKLVSGPNGPDGNPIEKVAFNTINIVKPQFTPKSNGEYHFSLQITSQTGQKSNISNVVVYVGQEYLEPSAIFPDVPTDHPNNLAITYLFKKNVMRGSQDPETGETLFRPDDTINRAEILKTIFENLQEDIPSQEELEALEEEIFVDVKPDHWFASYVYLAKQRGIVKGNDGLYRPADKVLLVEALKIIAESYEISLDTYQDDKNVPYPDAEAGAWYNPYLFFVKKYILFDADSSGNIQPGKQLSRAEFAEIIYRMETINLWEKRGVVAGKVVEKSSKEGIAQAEVLVYKAIEEDSESGEDGFITKGELFVKTTAAIDGSFAISLPIHTKFYIEALTEENVSANKVIIEVSEDETKQVELQVEEN